MVSASRELQGKPGEGLERQIERLQSVKILNLQVNMQELNVSVRFFEVVVRLSTKHGALGALPGHQAPAPRMAVPALLLEMRAYGFNVHKSSQESSKNPIWCSG